MTWEVSTPISVRKLLSVWNSMNLEDQCNAKYANFFIGSRIKVNFVKGSLKKRKFCQSIVIKIGSTLLERVKTQSITDSNPKYTSIYPYTLSVAKSKSQFASNPPQSKKQNKNQQILSRPNNRSQSDSNSTKHCKKEGVTRFALKKCDPIHASD